MFEELVAQAIAAERAFKYERAQFQIEARRSGGVDRLQPPSPGWQRRLAWLPLVRS